ncbi:type III pantothenate kinase [Chitinophaga sp. SYP-B3965]|uniref:type III pantothenate kinase n=1 Tax=Chitinophaga sp. SYP-B3965 TaxID=2663120 RepID=UPI00129996C9|nr:type III pantothenate kinase [Chitinophaga sp. SYP-B3965]MRG46777.1 type III pantothenate kinase [Chitinophaga sp. SYP-B3965]
MNGCVFCLDLGNSRLKCGVMLNGELQQELFFSESNLVQDVRDALDQYHPQAAILSSVVDHPEELETLLSEQTSFLKLDHSTPLPIKLVYEKPETLGVDRIALACGAWAIFPGKHNLIIGAGSAITYNFLNRSGEFLGGGISPGIDMRFRALHTFTDKLPLIKASTQYAFVGFNTRQSILSGVQEGALAEMAGMIASYGTRYRNFNVLLTGGNLDFFASRLKKKIFASPYLMYKGLNSIVELNVLDKS